MKYVLVALLFGLAACTPAQVAQVNPYVREGCVIDRMAQPVLVPLEAVGSVLNPIATVAIPLVHGGVQAGCDLILAPKGN